MDACLARLFHPAMEGGHLAPAQDRAKTKNQLAHDSKGRARRVPYPTAPPPPAATVVWIPSRMLVQGASHPGPRRSLFESLLLADATAKGIWRGPGSNPCSRASESPRIACDHADSLPPNADVNSLGTIRAFPSAAASGFFPAARRAGSICRCAVGIGQVASRFHLPSCQRLSFA